VNTDQGLDPKPGLEAGIMTTFSLDNLPRGMTIALCCECGEPRLASENFRRSRPIPRP